MADETARAVREARTLSVSVRRSPQEVHALTAGPRNLPRWSWIESVEPDGDRWRVRTPSGTAHLSFVAPSDLGVLDHVVEPAPGVVVHVRMRVVPNGSGSEVLITLLRPPGTTEEAFEEDARTVAADLGRLEAVLEG